MQARLDLSLPFVVIARPQLGLDFAEPVAVHCMSHMELNIALPIQTY